MSAFVVFGDARMLKSALLIPFSMLQSMLLLLKDDIVLGVGGYAGPVVLMASLMGKPTGIVGKLGRWNDHRILGRFVHRLMRSTRRRTSFRHRR